MPSRSNLARIIATVGGLGDRLPAPGTTAGSMPAAVVWWGFCAVFTAHPVQLVVTWIGAVIATVLGTWASGLEATRRKGSDPGPVAIDEVAGQWLCYAAVLLFVRPAGAGPLAAIATAGFFLFRFFDVIKPWPINRLERLSGGVGIVADDLAAGAAAGLVLAAAWIWLLPFS